MNINNPKSDVNHMSIEARRELYKVIKPMCSTELYDVLTYVRTILDVRKDIEENEGKL